MNYWPLLGVLVVIIGFMRRWNPVLVVVVAGAVAGIASGMSVVQLLTEFGDGFTKNRYLLIILLTLPVLGALERAGLREHAQNWIAQKRKLTIGRLLTWYLAVRQLTAAMGLTSLGGQAQTVRPLLAPMAEGSAQAQHGKLGENSTEKIRAMSAATDNVGLFFGEDIFLAFGAVLLIQGVYADNGIMLEPINIALWGIPTALCAFAIHAWRIRRFEKNLARMIEQERLGKEP
ncbi:MAG: DUF969 domain-containing protein [Arenimonas sp.]|nr:DUF969 domain-containing protein [Arenimonas sp.]